MSHPGLRRPLGLKNQWGWCQERLCREEVLEDGGQVTAELAFLGVWTHSQSRVSACT